MSKDYVGSLVRALVGLGNGRLALLQDLANKLDREGDKTGLESWDGQLRLFLKQEPCFVTPAAGGYLLPLKPDEGEVLKFVSTFVVIPRKFVAKDWFVVNHDTNNPNEVKVIRLSDNFIKFYLGKTEDVMTETTLQCHALLKDSRIDAITKRLGGPTKVETTLAAIFSLLNLQRRAQDGLLRREWPNNIFYVRDINGVLRLIRVYVGDHEDGWSLDVMDMEDPVWVLQPGCRVFSPAEMKQCPYCEDMVPTDVINQHIKATHPGVGQSVGI